MSTFLALTPFDFFPALAIGLTKLVGQDHKKFLQGQLTCDVDSLSPQQSLLGAHCDPKGKMLAIVRLLQQGDSVYALQPLDNVESHLPILKKYAVFSQVEISNASTQFVFTGLSGQQAQQWLTEHAELPSEPQDCVDSPFGLISSFPLSLAQQPRFLIISTEQQAQRLLESLPNQAQQQSSDIWHAIDILTATPEISPQISGEFIPQLLNLQMINGICWTKGCYIGQETIARMHYRGINKRAMFILSGSSQLNPQPGDSLERQVESGWRNAGTVIACQATEQQTYILATLPIDSEIGCQMRLKDSEQLLTLTAADYFELPQ